MKKKSLILLTTAAMFAGLFCLTFCACNDNKTNIGKDTLVVGTTAVIDSLNRLDANSGNNPGYNYDVLSGTISQLAPVAKNADGTFSGLLTDFDNEHDASVWNFTVKQGYAWHDGVAVSADDLIYTFSRQFDYVAGDINNSIIDNIAKTDDKSIKITLKAANPRFLNSVIVMRVMPKHLLEGKTAQTLSDADSVIGCGPFKFSSFDKNSGTLTFVKYDDYPNADKISFKRVVFKLFKETDVMHLALKSGDIDMEYVYSKGIDAAAENDFSSISSLRLDSYNDGGYPMNLFFNNQQVTNANVRKAVASAIDYAQMRSLFGTSFVSSSYEGFAAPGTIGYIETAPRTRNLDEARRLLSEAGYTAANKFSFNILVRSDGSYGEAAKVLVNQLEATGLISASITMQEPTTFGATLREHKHQACLLNLTAFGVGNQGGLGSMYFASTGNVPAANITDEDFLKIIDSLKNASTETEYQSAAAAFQRYCVENTPAISLFNDNKVQVYSKRLTGFNKDATFGLLNVIGWETLKKE